VIAEEESFSLYAYKAFSHPDILTICEISNYFLSLLAILRLLSASSIGERCGEQVRRLYSVFGESRRSSLLAGDNRRPSLQEAGDNRRPSLQEAGDKDEDQRTVRESPAKQEEGTRMEGTEGEAQLLFSLVR
jgi:hypothetical protein